MSYCYDCDIEFNSWHALRQHWVQSRQHHYCQRCDEEFSDQDDLEMHYSQEHIWCPPCNKFFRNMYGLNDHYRQSPNHHYCPPCNRLFQSESNLRAHLNSSLHKPKKFICPMRGCGLGFVSASALAQHIEAGTCVSGINHNVVDRLVRRYDKNHIIMDPSRMITAGDSAQETTLYATSATWNGLAYECYLCHNTYRTLPALNQHLGSPRHKEKMYVCPLNTCRTRFGTLSGLWQHVESERCGVLKFQVVRDTMDQLIGHMRQIAL